MEFPERIDVLHHNDLPFLCLKASIEIGRQIDGRDADYSPIAHLSEILANEAKRISVAAEGILYRVLSKYLDRKVTTLNDLQMEASRLASELKSARDMPKERLETLRGVCLELGKEISGESSKYDSPYRYLVAYA